MGARSAARWIALGAVLFAMLLVMSRGGVLQGIGDPVLDAAVGSRAELSSLRDEVSELNAQAAQQQNRIQMLGKDTDSLERQVQAITNEIGPVRAGAGETALVGPGVEIELSDAPRERVRQAGGDFDINWFLVHDRDVLLVLNLLKSAGAEALAVNGVRLDADTAVHCGGPAIYLRDIALTPPFILSAIGDPKTLETAVKGTEDIPTDVYLELTSYGLVFDIRKKDAIHIPSTDSTQAAGSASQAVK